jgi:hypothetical protein
MPELEPVGPSARKSGKKSNAGKRSISPPVSTGRAAPVGEVEPMTTSTARAFLVPLLTSVAEDKPLLFGFLSAFEARHEYPWLSEGFRKDDLESSLRGALTSALSVFRRPKGLTKGTADSKVAPELLDAFRAAIETLPDATVDRYLRILERHGIKLTDRSSVESAIKGALEEYIRTKDNGLTADPW